MATVIEAPKRAWAALAVKWGMQAFGMAVLTVTTWQGAVLMAASPRYFWALTYWLEVGLCLALWLPCWVGSSALIKGRPSGFRLLYLGAALPLLSGIVVFFPSLYPMMGPPQVGGTFRGWPAGLLVLVMLAIAHGLTAYFLPSSGTERRRRSRGRLVLPWACFGLFIGCTYLVQGQERSAEKAMQEGVIAYEDGRHEDALAAWRGVIEARPYTPARGKAVFNTGFYHLEKHNYRDAMPWFESLLGSNVNDHEPGGNLMEAYRNYRHLACLELSSCHEGLGDLPSALRYAILARDKYRYRSWCLTCSMGAFQAIADRIDRLERRAGGGE